jgi:hypothetical protein
LLDCMGQLGPSPITNTRAKAYEHASPQPDLAVTNGMSKESTGMSSVEWSVEDRMMM